MGEGGGALGSGRDAHPDKHSSHVCFRGRMVTTCMHRVCHSATRCGGVPGAAGADTVTGRDYLHTCKICKRARTNRSMPPARVPPRPPACLCQHRHPLAWQQPQRWPRTCTMRAHSCVPCSVQPPSLNRGPNVKLHSRGPTSGAHTTANAQPDNLPMQACTKSANSQPWHQGRARVERTRHTLPPKPPPPTNHAMYILPSSCNGRCTCLSWPHYARTHHGPVQPQAWSAIQVWQNKSCNGSRHSTSCRGNHASSSTHNSHHPVAIHGGAYSNALRLHSSHLHATAARPVPSSAVQPPRPQSHLKRPSNAAPPSRTSSSRVSPVRHPIPGARTPPPPRPPPGPGPPAPAASAVTVAVARRRLRPRQRRQRRQQVLQLRVVRHAAQPCQAVHQLR